MRKDAKAFYEKHGYYLAKGVFSPAEAAEMIEHFMARRAEGPKPGDLGGDKTKGPDDPLNKYPRMINMHDWDEKTAAWEKDARLRGPASKLVGDDLKLSQTMLYFKPPGARGQGLHQDNQYIRKYPIIAAWVALDACTADNGQMVVVPGSNKFGILPVQEADPKLSFVGGETVIPEGSKELGVDMDPGDVLFFGGFTIHGSYPNKTKDRFRRSFICHYFAAHTKELVDDPDQVTSMSALRKRLAATH